MKILSAICLGLLCMGVQAETIHIKPETPHHASNQNINAMVFKDELRRAAAVPGMAPVDTLKMAASREDAKANRYQRYQQYYKGLKVYGKQVVVRSDQRNMVRSITGNVERDLELDTKPGLSGAEAIAKGLADAQDVKHYSEPELLVYLHQGKPRLVYMAVVEYTLGGQLHLGKVFVDANSGERISFKTHIQNSLERRIYDLDHKCVRRPGDLPGTFRFGEDLPADADPAEKGAYTNGGFSYWFYRHMFNRDSFDAKGAALVASVHAEFPADFQNPSNPCAKTHSNNAFFAGDPVNQMIYGDGDGKILDTPSAALDIVAHELSHGVTFSTSQLDYENESGALNEAFSDIMGATAEAWQESGGSSQGNPPDGIRTTRSTWEMGGTASPNKKLMRYMNDPTKDGRSKDNYAARIKLASGEKPSQQNDFGGVHLNSGIINLAYYLLAEGGKHPQGATDVEVPGIGIESAAHIYYQANTNYFGPTTNFEEARYALADSAEVLYGECSREWSSTHRSMDAVQVPGDWDAECKPGGSGPQPTVPLAQQAKVTASSIYSLDYDAAKAADGKEDTFWASTPVSWWQRGYEYLIFEWPEARTVTSVEPHYYSDAYSARTRIYYSDGKDWQVLGNEVVSTRRIAVLMTGHPVRRLFAVREVEIK